MMDKPDKEKLPTLAEVADALKLWDDPCLRRRPRYGTAVQQAIDDLSDGVPVLWCPCGACFPEPCGAYGCPNCHGDQGPAVRAQTALSLGSIWPNQGCYVDGCKYVMRHPHARLRNDRYGCVLNANTGMNPRVIAQTVQALVGRWNLAGRRRQVLAGTGKGSGLVIAGALVSWLADGANEKRNCVGALLVVLSALCHARDVWISLPGPQAAVVLSRQVVGLADDLRRMGVDVDARVLWRMLRWSARHGMSMRARSPLDLGVTPEMERQAAFDLWVAQRGRVG